MTAIRFKVFIEIEFKNINWFFQSSTTAYERLFNLWNIISKARQKKTRAHIQNEIDIQYSKKKFVKMLNIVSIVDNYIHRLNNIFYISDELKKNFNNRNVSIIDKFYNLYLKRKRRLFLNSSFNCIRFLNNFSNDIANSFQQIISDILLFFV